MTPDTGLCGNFVDGCKCFTAYRSIYNAKKLSYLSVQNKMSEYKHKNDLCFQDT